LIVQGLQGKIQEEKRGRNKPEELVIVLVTGGRIRF